MHPDIHARPHPAGEYDLTDNGRVMRAFNEAAEEAGERLAARIRQAAGEARRDTLAMHVMAALAGHHGVAGVHPHFLAATAVSFADALIAELDRRPEEGERPVEHDG